MKYLQIMMIALALMLSGSVQAQTKQEKAEKARLEKAEKAAKAKEAAEAKKAEKARKAEEAKKAKEAKKAEKAAKGNKAAESSKTSKSSNSSKGAKTAKSSKTARAKGVKSPDVTTYDVKLGALLGQKIAKEGTPQYLAQRQAVVVTMDSIIKYAGRRELAQKYFGEEPTPAALMRFSDLVCQKFNWDPVLMDSIASGYYTLYNNEHYGKLRYGVIKSLYPKYIDAYFNEARLFHQMAWKEDADGWHIDPDKLEDAKEQLDSAKIVMPDNEEPYMLWARLQAPHIHHTKTPMIDEELAELKAKFPSYPCYLEIARYYEEILAKKDKNFLLDAAAYYEKAGSYNELTAAHWTNFSMLVFQYFNSFPEPDYGVSIANRGLELFPNHPPLIRAKLWNYGRYEKWDNVLEMADSFFVMTDTLVPSFNDYKFIANAYMNKGRYTEAIDGYVKELEMVKDTLERLNAIIDLMDCYNRTSQYNKTIETFPEYEALRLSFGRRMEYAHYNQLINAYIYLGVDSAYTVDERIHFLEKADSVCQLAAEASPEYLVRINDVRFWTILVGALAKVKYNGFNEEFVVLPEFLEGAQRLYKSAEEQEERKDNDYYFMMKGYYWAMIHYSYLEDEENLYLMSEKMCSVDMPSEMELVSLSKERQEEYAKWVDKAVQINIDLSSKFGRKNKKRR